MRNSTYRGKERYLHKEGYRSKYYEDRLQQSYERRHKRYMNVNSLRRDYINQIHGDNLKYYYCHKNRHMKVDCLL